ncbi:MAG: phosphatidylglycerol lysyltransferase domain-containing protein [Sulfitobacter sp.]
MHNSFKTSIENPVMGRPQVWAVPLLILFAWLMINRLHPLSFDFQNAMGTFGNFSVRQWSAGVFFTGLSLLGIGGYDATAHRVLRTGVSTNKARKVGIRAIAVAQLAGFGTATAALVRCRLLRDLSIPKVGALSAFVSLSFFVVWAILAGAVVFVTGLPVANGHALWWGGALAVISPLLCWFFRDRLEGVGLKTLGILFFWALLDTLSAAVVLWVFLPSETPFGQMFAAYLLALGAGLISNSPGGLGAFDLCLFVLLPDVDVTSMLSAICAYRLVYLIAPALVFLPSVIWPAPKKENGFQVACAADLNFPCPEWGLHRQDAEIITDDSGLSAHLVKRTGSYLVGIGRALNFRSTGLIVAAASSEGRAAVLYKLGARDAAVVRRSGWVCLKIGANAVIDLKGWTLNTPLRRQLRRKLKQATKAGVTVREALSADLPSMTQISASWAKNHGKEWGFSMGVFDSDYLTGQRIFVAVDGQDPIAFVSFHANRQNWVLDLIRYGDAVPSGTIQTLVTKAIEQASSEGVVQLSLASVPQSKFKLTSRLRPGLTQFKTAFAPIWEPLYLCVPSHLHLPFAMASIGGAVRCSSKVDQVG